MDQNRTHRFLLLEDDDSDVFLMRRQLERKLEHVELLVASTQGDYEELVRTGEPDVILSDYRLPRYSGIEALLYAREHNPLVPFVFITGALHDEELAADTILQGASGFVLKNNLEKLWRLLPDLLERGSAFEEGEDSASAKPDNDAGPDSASGPVPAETGSGETGGGGTGKGQLPEAIAERLANADAETLAKIQRILAGEE